MIFTDGDYYKLYQLFNTPGYRGYKPEVKEAPNGDGVIDVEKRYLHVAAKYDPPEWAWRLFCRAFVEACKIAEALEIPREYFPSIQDSTLRVLEYGSGADSAEHTDFDLFTVHCYRNTMEPFVRLDPVDPRAEAIDPGVHFGEIGELLGLGRVTRHLVLAGEAQEAIVFFAMPPLTAKLGLGTVGSWLAERYARSRYK